MRAALLLAEMALKQMEHAAQQETGLSGGKGSDFTLSVRGSRVVFDTRLTVKKNIEVFSHRLGSHSHGIKMSTLFECQ